MRKSPNALQAMFGSNSSVDLAASYPSRREAITLWNIFDQRVHPLVRISFSWALKSLRSASIEIEDQKQLTDAEHAFVFSLYLLSVISLSDEDCLREMHQPRPVLLSDFQMLCEEALTRTNLLCITDITVLKALTLYMVGRHSTCDASKLKMTLDGWN